MELGPDDDLAAYRADVARAWAEQTGEHEDSFPLTDDEVREGFLRMKEKMDFVVGMPEDVSLLPETRYQVLLGRVYVLQRWGDGSTARGEETLDFIAALSGSPAREGWYDGSGAFLGRDPGLPGV